MSLFLDKITNLIPNLIDLFISINACYSSIFSPRNCLPGFKMILPRESCCEFHFMQNVNLYAIEPVFTKLFKSENSKVSLIADSSDVSEVSICPKAESCIEPILAELHALTLNPNLTFHKLYDNLGNINNESDFFICDKEKIACLSIKGWLFPLVSSFKSFNSSLKPEFAFLWNFKIATSLPLKTATSSSDFLIDLYSRSPLSISLLTFESAKILYVDNSRIHIKLKKNTKSSLNSIDFTTSTFKTVLFDSISCQVETLPKKPAPSFSNFFYIYFVYLLLIFATGIATMEIVSFAKLGNQDSLKNATIPFFLIFLFVIGLFNFIFIYSDGRSNI